MRFVHIAGTNGKGSTAEYISAILTEAGYRCGCYTSPHLLHETERMRIDGVPIGAQELERLMTRVRDENLAVNSTLFAAYTAASLLWFANSNVDFAVMETGLGGRLDPTNQISPDVCILTSIDIDHTQRLGTTLTEITEEKSGIIKPGVPVVSAVQHPEAAEVIRAHCRRKDSPLITAKDAKIISRSTKVQVFTYSGRRYQIPSIGLVQPCNAALCIEAARLLGIPIRVMRRALKKTRLPGRAQLVGEHPRILIDGSHNPAAIKALCDTIDTYFQNDKKVLLFACMADKDAARMIELLGYRFASVITTNVDEKRGESPNQLQKLFQGYTHAVSEPDAAQALQTACNAARNNGAMLIVCGSIYLAGFVLGSAKSAPHGQICR